MNLYLFFGFSVIWIVLFCFLLFLFSQQRKLAAAIDINAIQECLLQLKEIYAYNDGVLEAIDDVMLRYAPYEVEENG